MGEAQADFLTGSRLVDRVLCAGVDWIEDEVLDDYRTWIGVEDGQHTLLWHAVKGIARQQGIKAHGHFGGEAGLPDARTARLALLLFAGLEVRPEAVLLVRDTDGDSRREQGPGLVQARNDRQWPFQVVVGAAHTKRECWILAGFDALGAEEGEPLSAERTLLGFDPCEHAERLTAKRDADKRSAKRVLAALTGGDPGREDLCVEADLDLLKRRGGGTGLGAFLREVEERVLPLFR